MAKQKGGEDDITPATLEAATTLPDPRDVKIAAMEVELADVRRELESRAAGQPLFALGKRYRIGIKDGPTFVVEPTDGEHPYEAYKRVSGVISSVNPFEFHETEEPVGRVA